MMLTKNSFHPAFLNGNLNQVSLASSYDGRFDDEIRALGMRTFLVSCPMGDGSVIVRKDLRNYIYDVLSLSDEELDDPYAHVDISNAILVLGFMKTLHTNEIEIAECQNNPKDWPALHWAI